MAQKKNNKFVVTTLAATTALAGIAPAVVAADEVGFSDVTKDGSGKDYYEAVTALAAKNAIDGYGDNTYRPYEPITRSQSTKLFVNGLELKIPENVSKVLENFNDVDENSLHADTIAAAYEAGIFQGSDGNFNDGSLAREQMATVIVRAFDLKDTGEEVSVDIDSVNRDHKESVKILAQHGITTVEKDFMPQDPTTRGQFANFLYKAMKVTASDEVVVENVTAINPNTISVTFEGMDEPVEIELDEALTDGENEVTFEYEGNEYTTTVDFDAEAYAVQQATEAVEAATESYEKEDIDAAQELVNDLSDSDEKVLLNHRLEGIRQDVQERVDAVNSAVQDDSTNALDKALSQKPFHNYDSDNRNDYMEALTGNEASADEIQEVIDTVNEEVIAEENAELVYTIDTNLDYAETRYATDYKVQQENFDEAIADAQNAIDQLPGDWTKEDSDGNEYNVKETYQERLDEVVTLNQDYVNRVKAVVDASDDYAKKVALTDGGFDFVEDNLQAYDFSGMTKVDEVQYEIDFTNAEQAINNFEVDSNTTQEDIDELEGLVPVTGEDEDGEPKATDAEQELLDKVEGFQEGFDNLVEATKALDEAVVDAKTAQEEYLNAGGTDEDDVYKDVDEALKDAEDVNEDSTFALQNATATLKEHTNTLEDATKEKNELAEAVEAAESAQEAYLAAGGDKEDPLYVNVQDALDADPQVTGDIENATVSLEEETAKLELVSSINAAETATELQTLLVKLDADEYNNLTSTQRNEVAELFLAKNKDGDIADVAAAETMLGELVTKYNGLLDSVNDARSITETRDALNAIGNDTFDNYSASEKLEAAENVLDNKPENGGYTSFGQIVSNFVK